jgi:hypothetical protein
MGVPAVVVALLLSGCAAANRPDVEGAVTRFYDAYGRDDGAAACALLAPATRREVEKSAKAPCAEGLLDETLPSPGAIRRASVHGDQAQVRLAADTAFVARFPGGWKVVAVGCQRRPDRPYDCAVEAG